MSGAVWEQRPGIASRDGFWKGKVATDAADSDSTIDVFIEAFNLEHTFGPCRWMPRDGIVLPLRGDDCLVVFDDNQIPYVIMWW